MKIKKLYLTLVAAATALASAAAEPAFAESFADSTLRIDYVMSGMCGTDDVSVAFGQLSRRPGWHGRRHSPAHPVLEGAADVTVVDKATGDTLYRETFSTLFQEWLVTGDESGRRSMPGVAMIPYPRRPVEVTVNLRNNRRNTICSSTLQVDPADILIADRAAALPPPCETVFCGSAPDSAKIRIAIMAEGYTTDEMPQFVQHAREAADAILAHEPFASLAKYFDFVAVETPSLQSGVSVPLRGEWTDTPFKSHFSTFYSDRYLTTERYDLVADVLAATGCVHPIILANTEEYGGGGIYNLYTLTAARHPLFHPVVVHEFGHSFGGLGDEYYYESADLLDQTYPLDIEPWEPNITTLVETPCKWHEMIDSGEADLIEGGGYRSKGIWRSSENCRMRTNQAEAFCPVCIEAIRRVIMYYISTDK